MIEFQCEQLTDEWFDARLALPTASQFKRIVTPGGRPVSDSVRQGYLDELAAEAISRIPADHYVSWEMKAAAEMEPDSRRICAMNQGVVIRETGLCYKDERKMFSCSPDGLIDPNAGFETKGTVHGRLQLVRLRDGTMMKDHIPQVQGNLYICEREWWFFQSYSPGLPEMCVRVYRDEKYIKLLADELERFCMDLAILIRKYKGAA